MRSSDTLLETAADLMRCMAHPTRLAVLAHLAEAPSDVGTLARRLDVEQTALSHHLRRLRDTGLVRGDRHGRHVRYRLDDQHVATIIRDTLAHAAERNATPTETS